MIFMEIQTSVDEMTLNFLPDLNDYVQRSKYASWDDMAIHIVDELVDLMKLEECLGSPDTQKGIFGYDTVSSFGNRSVPIAYHSVMANMGICLKFTASGFKQYCQRYVQLGFADTFEAYDVLQKFNELKDNFSGQCRVTKVDLTIDFFDYPDLSVSGIYQGLASKQILLLTSKKRINNSKIDANVSLESTDNNEVASTIYIGTKKKNTAALFRIYDKKKEQEEKTGAYLEKAKKVKSWIRFEVSFRQKYAHQIGEQLQLINSASELSSLICACITDKYIFTKADKQTVLAFSQEMLDGVQSPSPLFNEQHRNNDLFASALYLRERSGLASFLFKISEIYGQDELQKFFDWVADYMYNEYEPNDDVELFLTRFKASYQKRSTPWQSQKQP